MPQANPLTVNLAGLCVEGTLYGIFFTLFVLSSALLISRARKTSPHASIWSILCTPLIAGSLAMFVAITVHWVIEGARLVQAVNSPEGPLIFYLEWSQPTFVAEMGFFIAAAVIGDALIIYRLWVVWNYRKLVVVFPILGLVGLLTCGIGLVQEFPQLETGAGIFQSSAARWATPDCVFTICTNVYCSAMIAYKLWLVDSRSQKYGGPSLGGVLAIVVESATFYTAWALVFFVTYQTHQNICFLIVNCWPAVSGITCMMINVRAGLGWALEGTNSNLNTSTVNASRVVFEGIGDSNSKAYVMNPLASDSTNGDQSGYVGALRKSRQLAINVQHTHTMHAV